MKKNLVLCLGSGGVRGLAHLGVYKSLFENNIPIHAIYGCSAGSLIGAFIAHGYEPQKIIELAHKLTVSDFLDIKLSFSGYIGGAKLNSLIRKYIEPLHIEKLKKPLVVVAANVKTGEPKYFKEGILADIVQASCAIPKVFHPKIIDGVEYLDGDLCSPVPVARAREDHGSEALIMAVNVMAPIEMAPRKDYRWAGWIGREIHRNSLVMHERKHADFWVHPEMSYGIAIDRRSIEERIRIGYEATQRIIPDLKRILVTV